MLRNILKMFIVRLLFICILIYYTEARGFYDPHYEDEVFDIISDETKEVPTPTPLDRDKEKDNLTATDEKSTTTSRPYYSNRTKELEDAKDQTSTTETYKTTTTRRPYHSYWGYGFKNTNGTSATYVSTETINNKKPSDLDNERERNESTTTRRSYHSYWGNELESKTPAVYDNRYNRTTDGNEQPANDDDDVGYGYLTLENGYLTAHFPKAVEKTKTTERPYIPGWGNWGQRPGAYYTTTTTTENSDTTTTERPYIAGWHTWERRPGGYNTITPTTAENSNTMTTRRPYVIYHRGRNSTVGSRWPTSTDGPVKISINSSVNTNGAGNYVAIADFLKKLTGAMLPGVSNIAPNSNITNLAVANGNGNVFFYIYN